MDLKEDPEAYGPMKVACEQIVRDGAASSMVIRPGLIVGPGDPSGRFTYWPVRLADGGEVLAPGARPTLMQMIDVRDLAAWVVTAASSGRPACTTASARRCRSATARAEVRRGRRHRRRRLTWVARSSCPSRRSSRGWGPEPCRCGCRAPSTTGWAHDVQPSFDAGLALRPIADTARDTLAWLEATPDAAVRGIDLARERELLDAWHARTPG